MPLKIEEDHCVHPKLRNINLHYITHSVISQIPRQRMFIVHSLTPYCHISLPYITNFIINASRQRSQPIHTLALRHVSICGVSPSSSFSSYDATCWMLVHACATSPGKAKWSGPHQRRREENKSKFHSVTCYTNSIVPHIHVHTIDLCNITCTLVATYVIQRSLECIMCRWINVGFVEMVWSILYSGQD